MPFSNFQVVVDATDSLAMLKAIGILRTLPILTAGRIYLAAKDTLTTADLSFLLNIVQGSVIDGPRK